MDFTIGKFFVALSITFGLFLLIGQGSSTAASPSTQSNGGMSAGIETASSPKTVPAPPAEYHSASGEGRFMADGQLVGGR